MDLLEPTAKILALLAWRHRPELELYQQLGFPDGFSFASTEGQSLLYGKHEVMLKGGVVLGHPHRRHYASVPWDGVLRPVSIRQYRARVQELAPRVPPGSPLGQSLERFDMAGFDAGDARWPRLVEWWALSQRAAEGRFEEQLGEALRRLGNRFTLRVAAELISPDFAKNVLVASGHWPPSQRPISAAQLDRALPGEWPAEHQVRCLVGDQDLGEVESVRRWARAEIDDDAEVFEEPYRAAMCALGAERDHALTGDGEVWRRERGAWRRCGTADEELTPVLPFRIEER